MSVREVVMRYLSQLREAIDEMHTCISITEEEFLRSKTHGYSLRYSVIQAVEAAANIGIVILGEKVFSNTRHLQRYISENGGKRRDLSLNGGIYGETCCSKEHVSA